MTATANINVNLNNIKNLRDLSSVVGNARPTKILRTGCVSKASDEDIEYLKNNIDFRVLVDLRSPAEIEEDEHLYSKVYNGFKDFAYKKSEKAFVPREVPANVTNSVEESDEQLDRRRYFISLMSESLIKKGIFFRLRKRIRFKALGLYLLSIFSRRAEKKVRNIFISKINGGGLSLLNELVVDTSGKEIIEVLKLMADSNNYPIGIYCTAGKDRTGLVTMLALSVLGASDEDIVADYVLSDSAYKDINDKKAMPEVMWDTINYIRNTFGSINAYLDQHGFDESWREKLRNSMLLN
eukprot:gene30570-39835_t